MGVDYNHILEFEPKVGDTVESLDLYFTWTKQHILPKDLERLRFIGDDSAEGSLKYLNSNKMDKGIKINNLSRLMKMKELVQNKPKCPKEVLDLYNEMYSIPSWVDFAQIKRGQELYWTYFPLVKMILLHCSLIGGFAAKRIVSTLNCTNYLNHPEKAYPRILETALFVMDCMSIDELKPDGKGWLAAFNVRMMHAQVRKHVSNLPKNIYDKDINGLPINQEDLLSTLLVFSYVILYQLERIGIQLTYQQKADYMASWRYIAYLLGIKDENNHFKSYNKSKYLRESISLHIFEPDSSSSTISLNVLKACTNQPPFFRSFLFNVELTRFFIGDKRSDALNLPHSKLYKAIVPFKIKLSCFIVTTLIYLNKDWFTQTCKRVGYATIGRILGNANPSYNWKALDKSQTIYKSNKKSASISTSSKGYHWWILLFIVVLVFVRNTINFNSISFVL